MEEKKNYYKLLLEEALTAAALTAQRLGYLEEGYPDFVKNLEDLWILNMTKFGLKIRKEDDPIKALKSFLSSQAQNEKIMEFLSEVEEISIDKVSENSIDLEVKRCPYMELHHIVKQTDFQKHICLLESAMLRGAERFMAKREALNHSFEFNLPEKPCKIHFEKNETI